MTTTTSIIPSSLQDGFVSITQKKFSKALDFFLKRIDVEDPFWTSLGVGISLISLNRIQEALFTLIPLTQHPHLNAYAHFELGVLYKKKQQHRKALYHFLQTTENTALKQRAFFLISECLKKLKSYAEAETLLKWIACSQPRHLPAKLQLGEVLFLQKKYPQAITILKNTLTIKETPFGFMLLSLTYGLLKEEALELEYATKAFKIFPSKSNGLYLLGLLKRKGPSVKARLVSRILTKLFPKDADCWIEFGNLALQEQNWPKSHQAFNAASFYAPSKVESFLGMGISAYQLGDYEETLECLTKAFDQYSENPYFLEILGITYSKLHEEEKALLFLNKAHKIKPSFHSFLSLGAYYLTFSQIEKAKEHLMKSLELKPTARALENLGVCCALEGDIKQAKDYYTQALTLPDANRDTKLKLGTLLLQIEEFKQGWPYYNIRFYKNQVVRPNQSSLFNIKENSSLLIYKASSLEKTILFSSILPLIESQKLSKIDMEVDVRLIPIYKRSFPDFHFFTEEFLKGHRFKLASLIYDTKIDLDKTGPFLCPSIDQPPSGSSFLIDDPLQTQRYREKFRSLFRNKRLFALSWKAPSHHLQASQSIPIDILLQFIQQSPENIQWICLEDNYSESEKNFLKKNSSLHFEGRGLMEELDATASLLKAVDGVVTVDDFWAHFCGALGVSTYVLLSKNPNWYWGLERNTPIWYHSLHLIRQKTPLDWECSLKRCRELLISTP